MAIDPLYAGKEQSLVKHEVLRRYLSTFAHKIGSKWDSITYIDGFSGPWNSLSPDLKDSSFAIALSELRKARETHRARKLLRLRCFFVEETLSAFKLLDQFVKAQTDVEIEIRNARFEDSIVDVLNFLRADRSTFAFTLIDPKGWTGFPLDVIRPLVAFQPSEVLVNFMTSFIIRFVEVGQERDGLAKMFGSYEALDRIAGLQGEDRVDGCVFEYCSALKAAGHFEHVSPAVVLQPKKDGQHYHLIYGTRKPVGLKVFKDAERQAMDVMERARAVAEERVRQEKDRQSSFLEPEEMPDSKYYNSLRERYLVRSKVAVEQLLKSRQRVSYDAVWATALSQPLVWENDLKAWIASWKAANVLSIEGLGNERTPKPNKGHFLTWIAATK